MCLNWWRKGCLLKNYVDATEIDTFPNASRQSATSAISVQTLGKLARVFFFSCSCIWWFSETYFQKWPVLSWQSINKPQTWNLVTGGILLHELECFLDHFVSWHANWIIFDEIVKLVWNIACRLCMEVIWWLLVLRYILCLENSVMSYELRWYVAVHKYNDDNNSRNKYAQIIFHVYFFPGIFKTVLS